TVACPPFFALVTPNFHRHRHFLRSFECRYEQRDEYGGKCVETGFETACHERGAPCALCFDDLFRFIHECRYEAQADRHHHRNFMYRHSQYFERPADALNRIGEGQRARRQREQCRDEDEHCKAYGNVDAVGDAFGFYGEPPRIDQHCPPLCEEEVHHECKYDQKQYQLQSVEQEYEGESRKFCQAEDKKDQQKISCPVVRKKHDNHEKQHSDDFRPGVDPVDHAVAWDIPSEQHLTQH